MAGVDLLPPGMDMYSFCIYGELGFLLPAVLAKYILGLRVTPFFAAIAHGRQSGIPLIFFSDQEMLKY